MLNRCPYPRCYREEHEDGEHQLGRPARPRGSLRLAQEFIQGRRSTPPCDLHNAPWPASALGFYVDMMGFGWMLCYPCIRKFGAVEDFSTTSTPSTKSTASTKRAKILNFAERERGAR